MNRPVKSFKNACTSAWKWSSRFPVTKVCSYKILKFCISHLSFFLATFFFSSHKTISWYILAYHTSNKCEYMTLILNNRLFADGDSKRKITCRLSSTSVTNIKCDGGKEEEETEVFLETLARLLIDPAIGHFKLGCFNQPSNSSMRAFSFYVFFSDRTLLCLVIL